LFYAGGGAGGGYALGGTGGSDVGGDSDNTGAPTANTGSGGGGNRSFLDDSGAAATGIVILRYPDTLKGNIGSGLTGSESAASGGYKRLSLTAGTGNLWFT
jgi:hypothetical protein